MRVFKAIIINLLFLITTVFGSVKAQSDDDTKLYYSADYSGGGIVHSHGFGVNFRYSQYLTGSSKRIWSAELLMMKHPKEKKVYNPYNDNARGYFFGKINSLTSLRMHIGRQDVIFGKELKKGVEISWVYSGGPILGIVKPVYLEITEQGTIARPDIINVERYDPDIHNPNIIHGRAGIFTGLSNSSLVPGASARLAMNFEYAPLDKTLKALEIGAVLDAYSKEVPIMANTDNNQFWLTFYLNIQFGKKII